MTTVGADESTVDDIEDISKKIDVGLCCERRATKSEMMDRMRSTTSGH